MSDHWPTGVSDHTALPYATWRVLDALSSKDPATVQRELNLSESQFQEVMNGAQQAAVRAQRQSQPLSDALTRQVREALISSVGPIGGLILEDTLDDLAPQSRLNELLRAIGQELQEGQRQAFVRQLRQRELI